MGDRAKIQGKAKKLLEWLKGWDGFDDYLKLNAIVSKEDDASLNIVVNDEVVQRFIDGSAIRDFSFQVKMVYPWSDGYDDTNSEAFDSMSSLLDWLDEQIPTNAPDWDGAEVMELIFINNVPSLDYVLEGDEMAEYSVTAKIRYKE